MATLPGIAAAAAQLGIDSILIKPKRAIGAFTAQVTVSEQHQDDLQITDHPVEQGSTISDHAYMLPATVTITAMWSNSPSDSSILNGLVRGVTGTVSGSQSLLTGNSASQVKDIYAKLLELQSSRIPFDVYTGKRFYKNMMVQRMSVATDKSTENVLSVSITCRQVIIVGTRTVSVPAPIEQQAQAPATASPVNAGQQSLQPGTGYVSKGSTK